MTKLIIQKLSQWPLVIEIASNKLEPHRIATYLYELASEFHSYWNLEEMILVKDL